MSLSVAGERLCMSMRESLFRSLYDSVLLQMSSKAVHHIFLNPSHMLCFMQSRLFLVLLKPFWLERDNGGHG